jgi:hypothetical protein
MFHVLPIAAATDIAPSASPWRVPNGSKNGKRKFSPTPYFHVVFTLPEPITAIAYENKDLVYDVWGLSSITAHL